MSRFRRMRSIPNFAAMHSSVHNYFKRQRNIEGAGSNRYMTPRFTDGADSLLSNTCSSANSAGAFTMARHRPLACRIVSVVNSNCLAALATVY